MRLLLLLLPIIFAIQTFAHGDLHQRIAELSQQIEEAPDSAQLYLKRARLYHQHGDFEEARLDYHSFKAMVGSKEEVDLQLSLLFYENGDLDSALTYANNFLNENSNHIRALFARGDIHSFGKDFESAISDYEKGLKLTQEPIPENYLSLADFYNQNDKPQKVLSTLELGQQRLGDLISFQEEKINYFIKYKQYTQAIFELDLIISKLPRHEKWLAQKAKVLELAGEEEKALEVYNQTIAAIEKLPVRFQHTEVVETLQRQVETSIVKLETRTN